MLNIHLMETSSRFENALCVNARPSIVSLIGSQRLNPSEVLSLILEKEVNAIFTAGKLKQLKCSMVGAYLQPTLRIQRSHF